MTQERKWSHSGSSSPQFSFQIKTFIPVRDLSQNHINGDQTHSWTRPANVPVSARVVLFFFLFSAVLLRALYLVRPHSEWVRRCLHDAGLSFIPKRNKIHSVFRNEINGKLWRACNWTADNRLRRRKGRWRRWQRLFFLQHFKPKTFLKWWFWNY